MHQRPEQAPLPSRDRGNAPERDGQAWIALDDRRPPPESSPPSPASCWRGEEGGKRMNEPHIVRPLTTFACAKFLPVLDRLLERFDFRGVLGFQVDPNPLLRFLHFNVKPVSHEFRTQTLATIKHIVLHG